MTKLQLADRVLYSGRFEGVIQEFLDYCDNEMVVIRLNSGETVAALKDLKFISRGSV